MPDERLSTDVQGYIEYNAKDFSLWGGRRKISWGPGYTRGRFRMNEPLIKGGNLLVSENAGGLDGVGFDLSLGPFAFRYFTAILQPLPPPIQEAYELRNFTAHRVEWNIIPQLKLSFSESVLYAGALEPLFTNPLGLYYAIGNYYLPVDGNSFYDLDLEWTILEKMRLYWELMIDDINYSEILEGKRPSHPNRGGVLVGFSWEDILGVSALNFVGEYTAITRWTYTHEIDANRYIQANRYAHIQGFSPPYIKPIGHWLGPDADDLYVEMSYSPLEKLSVIAGYEMERHGEGNVLEKESQTWNVDKFPSTPFLTGVVERFDRASIGAKYNVWDWNDVINIVIGLKISYGKVMNLNHIQGKTGDEGSAVAGIEVSF